MITNKYTPPQKKVVTSIGLETDVREWLDENVENRSYFMNELIKRYIKREEARQARLEKEEAAA